MFKKLAEWSVDFLIKANKKRRLFLCVIFILMVAPTIFLSVFSVITEYQDHNRDIFDNKKSTAHFSAKIMAEKLNYLTDIGVSFSTRINFRKFVSEGKWDNAIQILKSAPADFPTIERIVLIDQSGNIMADSVENSDIIGKNLAYRDWYQGISKDWKPYVSEIFQASAAPYYLSIVAAVPIKDEDQKTLGILALQIRALTLTNWGKEIKTSESEIIYFVDKKGQSLNLSETKEETVDFSKKPYFAEVALNNGITIFADADGAKKIASYYPISPYNFYIAIEQPTKAAFAERNYHLAVYLIICFFILTMICLMAVFVLKIITLANDYRQKEKILLGSVGDGLVGIDRGWNIVFWNSAAAAISGWAKEEAIGKPFRSVVKFIRENDRKENIEFIEKAMLFEKTEQMEGKTVIVRKDGKEIPTGDSASPMFDLDGKITGAVIIFRDMTKERQAQQISSEFSYASHQLRTPVNEAMWTLEVLIGRKIGLKKLQEGVKTAYNSLKSVQKLVSQLLETTAIDQKSIIPKFEMIKITDVFSEVCETIGQEAKKRRVSLKLPAVPAMAGLNTDAKLLKRLLTEVLQNAVYYNRAGGEVEIKISFPEKNILIEVKDTGLGIPEQEQPLVFTKFFRGSNKPADVPGAGLGLFISREFARLLKGKIWFSSKEKEGTAFFVSLPLE